MKTIWILNQYNMPPELGHLNRHYNIGKYLKKKGYNPTVLVGSYLHNTNKQMIKEKKLLIKQHKNCDFKYYFIKTIDYSKNKFARIFAMFEYYKNTFRISNLLDKPDIILGSSVHPLAAIAAIKLSKKYECQSIVEIRDLWPETFVAYDIIKKSNPILKLLYAGEKWIYKKADRLIFTMEGGSEYIIDRKWDIGNNGPIDLDKVCHINNGIDLEAFEHNKNHYVLDDDDDLLKDSSYKIIYIGSLREANDSIWRLLEVAELFKTEGYEDIKFLIYGKGSEKEKMEEYCIEKNLDNVKIKGYVDKKYIPYILSCCDLNILNCSSRSVFKYGGSQNKLFDYLASGNPIISGETSKYSIINNYNCGISRKYENIEDLMEAILQMKNLDYGSKSHMNKNILKIAEEYDYDNLTQKLIKIIGNSD